MSEEEIEKFESYDIENGFEVRAGEAREYLVWCKDECIRQYVNGVIEKEYAEGAISDIIAMIKQVEEMKVKDWVEIFQHPMSPSASSSVISPPRRPIIYKSQSVTVKSASIK